MGEKRRILFAVSIFAGTIIGAGVFSLPYILSVTGVALGVALLVAFSALYAVVYRRYGDVFHRFRSVTEKHRFVYLSRKLLHPAAAHIASFSVLAELFLTLAAYVVLSASFAGLLGVPTHVAWVLFWAVGSAALFARSGMLGAFELLGTVGIVAVGFLIAFSGGEVAVSLIPAVPPTFLQIISFFGALIFMFSGRPAVPAAHELFGDRGIPSRVIRWGVAVPLLFYILFGIGVLHVTATPATDTVSGLVSLPPLVSYLVGILGLLALFTSYLTIGGNLKDILEDDVFHRKRPAAALTVLIPLFLVIAGLREFIVIIGIAGGVFLALEALFINRMWEKTAGAKRTFLTLALYALFGGVCVYEIGTLVRALILGGV